jgi:hypothetical protein
MAVMAKSKDSQTPKANKIKALSEQYASLCDEELSPSLGFSARLNMLWDLAGAVPGQTEGRVLAILGINPQWREAEVRKWLQRDVLPDRLELHNLVKFLVAQLEGSHSVPHWEAFLIYGSPTVSSPVDHVIYREDPARRNIATIIFAQLTDRYGIPPAAYDAEEVFQRCLTLMQKFKIYELRDFQPGHMEPFRNFLFPGHD